MLRTAKYRHTPAFKVRPLRSIIISLVFLRQILSILYVKVAHVKRACAILILSMLENDSDESVRKMAKEIVRSLI